MKKGSVKTCNGCLAFEESCKVSPPGSPFGMTSTAAFCGIGNDIEKIGKAEYPDYCPKAGSCQKPKTITDLIKHKRIFYENCELETERSNDR